MDQDKLKSIIESLLFVTGEPVKISKLARIAEVSQPEIENALMVLSGDYIGRKSGLILIRNKDEVQMGTNAQNAKYAERIIQGEFQESLTPAALEVLSIIAYRGPITRSDIESIRGVNSSYTLRNLLLRGLVVREENPKDARGYIYQISFDFLKNLGIEDTNKLPEYESLSKDSRVDTIINNP